MEIGTICNILGEGDECFVVRDVSENSVLVEPVFRKTYQCWESKRKVSVVSTRELKKTIKYFENKINKLKEGVELSKKFLNKKEKV